MKRILIILAGTLMSLAAFSQNMQPAPVPQDSAEARPAPIDPLAVR